MGHLETLILGKPRANPDVIGFPDGYWEWVDTGLWLRKPKRLLFL